MNISFTYRNLEPSEHLTKYLNRRFGKLGRFFGKTAAPEVEVSLVADRGRNRCEAVMSGDGIHLTASEQNPDMYAAVDQCFEHLENQVKKQLSRLREGRRRARNTNVDVFTYNVEGGNEAEAGVTGTNRFSPKPMSLDEAVMQLESIGSEFLVFLSADSGRVNVVYRRRNGAYGLIDPIV